MSDQPSAPGNRERAKSSKALGSEAKGKLAAIRAEIDDIDTAIVSLLRRRIDLLGLVVAIKSAGNLPILDPDRERAVIAKVRDQIDDAEAGALIEALFIKLFELSRQYQNSQRNSNTSSSQ